MMTDDKLSTSSNQEFHKARGLVFVQSALNFLKQQSSDLLPFEEIRSTLKLKHARDLGLQNVEVTKIVGSVGRYHDFTREFLPRHDSQADRWRRVYDLTLSAQGFPPVELFKVGDAYFVRDGNHRISVARANNSPTIEAYVTEYDTPVNLEADDTLDDILIKAGSVNFLQVTQLHKSRPEQDIKLTNPGRYSVLLEHIQLHKYLIEVDSNKEIPYAEAATSWYDTVYMPLIEEIRKRNTLRYFPKRTEADLYTWLILHRSALEEVYGFGKVDTEELIEAIVKPLDHVERPVRQKLNFLKVTGLAKLRPEQSIELSNPERYGNLMEHIQVHKYLKETDSNTEISYQEAVTSWFDTVYLPLVFEIRKRNILKHFPKRTETDLYVWLVKHRADLEAEQGLGQVNTDDILEDLEEEATASLVQKLERLIKRKLDPDSLPPPVE